PAPPRLRPCSLRGPCLARGGERDRGRAAYDERGRVGAILFPWPSPFWLLTSSRILRSGRAAPSSRGRGYRSKSSSGRWPQAWPSKRWQASTASRGRTCSPRWGTRRKFSPPSRCERSGRWLDSSSTRISQELWRRSRRRSASHRASLMSMTPAPRRKSRTAQGPTPARVYAERAHQLPRAPVDGRLGPAVVCDLPPDVQEHILEGIEQAERGEFAELSPEETQHYIQTGGLPPRLEHCVASLTSRPRS